LNSANPRKLERTVFLDDLRDVLNQGVEMIRRQLTRHEAHLPLFESPEKSINVKGLEIKI
jgi:hypothetical protein